VKVRATLCESCIFRPGSVLAERIDARLAEEWAENDTHQTCHQSAIASDDDDGLMDPETGEPVKPEDAAVCRGFYQEVFLKKGTGQLLRIMERLDGLEFSDDE